MEKTTLGAATFAAMVRAGGGGGRAGAPGPAPITMPARVTRAFVTNYSATSRGGTGAASQDLLTAGRSKSAGAACTITAANVPPTSASPAAGDAITFSGSAMAGPN